MTALSADIKLRRGDLRLQVSFVVEAGETVALLGPNGAGKSTLVHALAGLVPIDEGAVRAGDSTWEDPERGIRLTPQQRSVGVMFQGLLLFPALCAVDNVAYGLRAQGISRDDARRRALDVMDRFEAAHLARRMPSTLSGGEAQAVALARALAVEPEVLLLDEPMSALDVANRAAARRALRRALAGFEGAKVLVTHEPLEAMALAERLVVLESGRIVQIGTPADIRNRPRSLYSASLVGLNLLAGMVVTRDDRVYLDTGDGKMVIAPTALERGAEALATIHPRAITLSVDAPPPSSSARNTLEATIAAIDLEGDRVRVVLDSRPALTAEITMDALHALDLRRQQKVWATLKATQIDVYPA
ncbi:ABC transporter ATP-binding protein [soil metagenome]